MNRQGHEARGVHLARASADARRFRRTNEQGADPTREYVRGDLCNTIGDLLAKADRLHKTQEGAAVLILGVSRVAAEATTDEIHPLPALSFVDQFT